MAEIRALVIDDDAHFMELLRSSLIPYDVRIDATANPDDCLDRVASLRLDIVFISVEAPNKSGFKLFSRVKGLAKVLPVILVTSTIPPTEMTLHQKLKIHADDYWDKRDLTPETIVARLSKIISLRERHQSEERGEDESEDLIVVEDAELDELLSDITRAERSVTEKAIMNSQPDASTAHQERQTARATSPMRGLSLEELEALVAELSDSTASLEADIAPPASRTEAEQSQEREEIKRLQHELEEARRIARASPFSQDFFRLLENVRDKEKEIFDLNVKLEARKRELSLKAGTARQLAEQLLGALRLREHEQGVISAMEDDLRAVRADLERAREEKEALRQQQELEIKRHEASFALERERHADACRRYESTITEKDARHAEELRDEVQNRLATLEALEARLREERNHAVENALERERREHDERIQALKRAQEEQIASQEREREAARKSASEELARIHAALEQRLAEIRRQHDTQLAQQADEHAQAVRLKEQERKEALEALERRLGEERDHELEETRHQHTTQLREKESEHRHALAELEKRATKEKVETLRASSVEWEGRLAQSRHEHAKELATLNEEHERKRLDVEARVEARLSHEREQTAELRRVVNEMSAARGRLESQLDETRDQLESKLAALEVRHAEALREAEQNRLMDQQAAEKRLAEEKNRAITAAGSEWQQRLDRAQRERSEALQIQRQEYETRLAAAEQSQSEVTALRAELRRLQQQMREVESQHAEALRQIDKRREQEKTHALAALEEEWKKKLDQARHQHTEAQTAMKREQESALSAHEARQRNVQERGNEEIKKLRNEAHQLREKLAQLQTQQADGLKNAEHEREAALQALEALLTEKHSQTLEKTEQEWRKKVESVDREKASLLATAQRAQQDSPTLQALRESLAKKEGEIKTLSTEYQRLEQHLSEAKNVIAARERSIESLRREAADQAQTIASLKAMIGDFTVIPSSPDQPTANVTASPKPTSPKPAAPKPALPKPAAPRTTMPSAPTRGSTTPKAPPKTTSGSNRR